MAHEGSQRTNIILTDSALILWQVLIHKTVSLAHMRISSQMFQAQPAEGRSIYLHHAHNLHVRDFDSDDNFVIIGSARSNPWAGLFEKNLKFTDFGRLAMMGNGHHRGKVVLIAGTLMESTEATGDFFLNPESVSQLEQAFHVDSRSDLPDYEVLLETHSVGGAGRSPKIISARAISEVP
jgi:hypothetical protein